MHWYDRFAFGVGMLAAAIWLAASLVKIPKTAWIVPGVGGGRPSPELNAVLDKLRLQSRLNAAAALFTALSILLQVVPRVLQLK